MTSFKRTSGGGQNEASQGQDTHQVPFAVDDVDIEHRVLARELAHGIDGLGCGQLFVERQVVGVHQRAGGLLFAGHEGLQLGALGRAEQLEHAATALLVEGIEKIGSIVRRG
jgi:hypothetical protein